MPVYHSKIPPNGQAVGNTALLTFKTKFRGPINNVNKNDLVDGDVDIIDEALMYFKANVFFKQFEIQSDSDRVMIYLTLYISECLKKLIKCTSKEQATQEMYALAIKRFDIPGENNFVLNSVYAKPASVEEADLLRQYLTQLRQECGLRVVERVFDKETGKPSKWWLCFAKRRFMDISLSGHGQ
ncbi:actin-related protein 2/3 complex subunit 3-like protein [Leptotrombidium deliense]|uniref:Actin-related protein 2/3 complex subunit 3 n=1 Tax=Leptotrombidium deliense TaxID=299467 RepID=A0A443SC34_9ACAR|nr:actin-related protein 2/3 complex subunit 3-like protein [Leptotrombidium deliense]